MNKQQINLIRQQNAAFSNSVKHKSVSNFANTLIKTGAILGGLKGALDQPKSYVLNQQTMEVVPKKYNLLDRAVVLGVNVGSVLGLGFFGQK